MLFPGDRSDNRQVGYNEYGNFQPTPANYQNYNQRNYQNGPSYQQPHNATPRNSGAQQQWNQYGNQSSVSQTGYDGRQYDRQSNRNVQNDAPQDEMVSDASANEAPVQVQRPIRSVVTGPGAGSDAPVAQGGVHRGQ